MRTIAKVRRLSSMRPSQRTHGERTGLIPVRRSGQLRDENQGRGAGLGRDAHSLVGSRTAGGAGAGAEGERCRP